MYQFFVEPQQVGKDFITITGSDVNHIKNVLRMKPGEVVRVSCRDGRDFYCSVLELADTFVQLDIVDSEVSGTELGSRVYLFQALPKGDRMEYVVQKAVELGVYEIVPVAMKYCVVRLDEKRAQNKQKRWQAIAESAAKQSKRSRIPKVHPVMDFADAVDYAMSCDRRLVPYENARGMKGTRDALASIQSGESVSVLIGPEGGFAEDEIVAVQDKMQVVSLGKRILRTDTAAVAAMTMLMMHLEMQEEEKDGNISG